MDLESELYSWQQFLLRWSMRTSQWCEKVGTAWGRFAALLGVFISRNGQTTETLLISISTIWYAFVRQTASWQRWRHWGDRYWIDKPRSGSVSSFVRQKDGSNLLES